jgi:starch-binding outer membrane protein, SusD/RagB family
MKNYIKIFFGIISLGVLFSTISGCKKFIDRQPLGLATADDVKAGGGLDEKVFGLYGALRNWGMSDLPMTFMMSVRSDDAMKGSSPTDFSDSEPAFDNYQYVKDYWIVNPVWDDHFAFIYQCNGIIADADSLKLTDVGSITNVAEAKFLRAYAYFDLVRIYGQVPKIDFKVYDASAVNKPKVNDISEIYDLIFSDLQYAMAKLPLSWESKYIGRSTQGAAKALAAKANLYRQSWTTTLGLCEQIIASNQYALASKYYSNFKEDGDNNSESIFEIQMYVNSNGTQDYGNSYYQTQGVRGSGEWDLGWGFNVPTANLVSYYEPNDPRKNSTILFSGQSDDPATGGYGRTLPPAPPLDRSYWNKKAYYDPTRRAAITAPGDARFNHWTNIKIYRYADVLLMAAEAANEIGGTTNTTKALNYLEQVRGRARDGNAAILPLVTTTNQIALRDAIRKERRVEFAMEWERFYDLVRWGIAPTVLGPLGYQNKNRYYPIPQPNVDRSNGVLVQNPDY